MNSIQDTIENKILKVKENLYKRKENSKNNDLINELQLKKTKLLIDMGILANQKIRQGNLEDPSFDDLSESILELDKLIYENSMGLYEAEVSKSKSVCQCGYIFKDSDKFCAECGNKIEIDIYEENFITCNLCETQIDEDSNYCICCGKKV